MTKKRTVTTTPWDSADYFDSPQAIAAYLEAAIEDGDPTLLAHALGQIAKAKGMTQIARKTGLTREALYKSLRKGGDPRLTTFRGTLSALGLRLAVVPIEPRAGEVLEPRASS